MRAQMSSHHADWAALCKSNSWREGASVTQSGNSCGWAGTGFAAVKNQYIGTWRLWDSRCLDVLAPPWKPHKPRFVHLMPPSLF